MSAVAEGSAGTAEGSASTPPPKTPADRRRSSTRRKSLPFLPDSEILSTKGSFASSASRDCLGRLSNAAPAGASSEELRVPAHPRRSSEKPHMQGVSEEASQVAEDAAPPPTWDSIASVSSDLDEDSSALDGKSLDWATETLLLTHEPIRHDLAAMVKAAATIDDERPEEWRVRAFFRFFDEFGALLAQFFAVELNVHCDWLCGEAAGAPPEAAVLSGLIVAAEHRVELMRQHRELTATVQELAALENALTGREDSDVMGRRKKVDAVTARTVTKMLSVRPGGPKSMAARSMAPGGGGGADVAALTHGGPTPTQLLREGVENLAEQLKDHLRIQERCLPEAMRARFGDASASAPAMLVERILDAARKACEARPEGALRPRELEPLLTWVYHHLRRRDKPRAVAFAHHLPKCPRKRLSRLNTFFARDDSHDDRLRHLLGMEAEREPPPPGLFTGRGPYKRRRRGGAAEARATLTKAEMRQVSMGPESMASARDSYGGVASTRSDSLAGGAGGAKGGARERPSMGRKQDSTQVRQKNAAKASVTAALNAANANRDKALRPDDAQLENLDQAARAEAVQEMCNEGGWDERIRLSADRAEKIVQKIDKGHREKL